MSNKARRQTFNTQSTVIAVAGMSFPANATANSNMWLQWTGADLLSRTDHTAIWKANYTQQAGYYATAWHTELGNLWEDHTNHTYDFGTHPFPCDGTFDGSNAALVGTGDAGTVHYYEIAGVVGAVDTIGDATSAANLVTKGGWVTSARTCVTSGGNLVHKYWPDITAPTRYITVTITSASLNSPSSPAFLFGCSPWRANIPSSGQSDETHYGILRGIKLFSSALSITDITTEDGSGLNSAVTAAGQASVWYMNISPTPTDVTDKSGAGHNPAWTNANRPTLYSP